MTGPRGTETLDVVVVGDVMVDVVAAMTGALARGSDTPSTVTTGGGGSAANVACWLADLGAHVRFAGRVGTDPLTAPSRAALADAGVDVAHLGTDPSRATGTCVVLVEPGGERSMLPDPGANDGLVADDVPETLFRPGRHLHLSGYTLLREGSREAGLWALDRARAAAMTISVDPSSAAMLEAVGRDAFLGWTDGVAVLLANSDEAAVLAGDPTPARAAESLAARYGEVVVKLGADGALWRQGFIAASAPAERTGDVVDTTGAGDAFAAGFLASWLLHPEPEVALSAGNRQAARAIGRVGARP